MHGFILTALSKRKWFLLAIQRCSKYIERNPNRVSFPCVLSHSHAQKEILGELLERISIPRNSSSYPQYAYAVEISPLFNFSPNKKFYPTGV